MPTRAPDRENTFLAPLQQRQREWLLSWCGCQCSIPRPWQRGQVTVSGRCTLQTGQWPTCTGMRLSSEQLQIQWESAGDMSIPEKRAEAGASASWSRGRFQAARREFMSAGGVSIWRIEPPAPDPHRKTGAKLRGHVVNPQTQVADGASGRLVARGGSFR